MKYTNTLDEKKASEIMNSALSRCNMDPCPVPLKDLASYSAYRSEKHLLQTSILIVVLCMFLMLPLLFIRPSLTLTQEEDVPLGKVSYIAEVSSLVPFSSIHASIDEYSMPIYELSRGRYRIEPTINGELRVKATAFNDQFTEISTTVAGVDRTPPYLAKDGIIDGMLRLYIKDDGCGIDADSIYAVYDNGSRVDDIVYDTANGILSFSDPGSSVNIYVADNAGNELHMVLTKK